MRKHLSSYSAIVVGLMISCLPNVAAHAETTINLGVYNFPPIADVDDNNQAEGLLGSLITALEQEHNDLSFRIVYTSPQRRHLDFKAGLFDVIFFESPRWSWDGHPIVASEPLLQDDEVYVALKSKGRDQSFFDNVGHRTIVAISGYHYGFAGLSTNNAELSRRFNIEFSHSHNRNINLIKADRPSVAEIAIVSRSFLHTYLQDNPEDRDLFLVSDKKDQTYQLSVLAREDGPVSIEKIGQLLQPLIQSGAYHQMVRQYGLQLPQNLLPATTP